MPQISQISLLTQAGHERACSELGGMRLRLAWVSDSRRYRQGTDTRHPTLSGLRPSKVGLLRFSLSEAVHCLQALSASLAKSACGVMRYRGICLQYLSAFFASLRASALVASLREQAYLRDLRHQRAMSLCLEG